MQKIEKLNYIGKLIAESLEANKRGDKSYREEKIDELLIDNNKLDSLFFLFKVDKKVRQTFANKLGVNPDELDTFLSVLQKV